jgi:hypothetical protein
MNNSNSEVGRGCEAWVFFSFSISEMMLDGKGYQV